MSKNKKNDLQPDNKELVDYSEKIDEEVKKDEVLRGVVKCPRLNVRKLPDKKALIVSVLHEGEEVVIMDDGKDEWCKISIASEYKGYVMSKFIDQK